MTTMFFYSMCYRCYRKNQESIKYFAGILAMKSCLSCLACWKVDLDDNNDPSTNLTQISSKPTDASSESPSEKVNLSDQDALLARIRTVVDDEHLRQSQSYKVSDCEMMISHVRGAFEARKLAPKLEQFGNALYTIDQFVKGISAMMQAFDSIAQIVWGSFLILLMIAQRFTNLVDTILGSVTTLSKILPRFQIYSEIYPTERIKTCLGDICVCCVEFCAAVSKFLGRRSIVNAIRVSWDPMDQKFKELQRRIEESRRDFVEEVGLHHAKETHDWRKERTPESVKIPCHVINAPENQLFLQRPDIMKRIENHLLPSAHSSPGLPRLKTFLLHGLGGSGKTQLAAKFVYSHWDDYDIVLWAVADTEPGIEGHFLQFAQRLSLPDGGDPTTIRTNVMNWLRDCNYTWLLVFDNVESETLLRKYWPNSARGSVLITSRNRMLAGDLIEEVCVVDSLSDEQGAAMIRLILQRKVSDADQEHVEEVARMLCGLPLALAQMAGYICIHHIPVREFLELYKNGTYNRILAGSTTSLDHQQYQHTLETVWAMSFAKLSDEARTLLRIAVFFAPDSIPNTLFRIETPLSNLSLPPSLQVLHRSHDRLSYNKTRSSLTDQFLMKYNPQEASLSIHREVQKSARRELLNENAEALRTALFGAALVLHHAYPRQSPLGEPIPNWPACETFTKHVLNLLEVYNGEEQVQGEADNRSLVLLTELFCDCGVYLWARGRFPDSERLAHASIKIAEKALEPHDCLRAQPYTLLGCIYLRSEDKKENAVQALETALSIRDENLRIDYLDLGLKPPLHIDIQLANAYSNLGIAAKQMGQFERAAQFHKKALAIKKNRREDCAGFLLALSFHNLGKLCRLQGQIDEAAEYFRKCVDEMNIYKDSQEMMPRQGVWLCSLAEVEETLGRMAEAELHFSQSLQILKDGVGDSLDTGMASLRFGVFKFRAGKFEEAEVLFKDARKIFRNSSLLSQNKLACSFYWLGRTYTQLGKVQDANETYRKASVLYQDITGKQISCREVADELDKYEALLSDD
ncbi:hypothetical protein BGZ63DRAFT_76477 [Mariannaea sp. PMI_226]|nr:hypothetical protein BGZ63DRAFT_76477 [Mariannaea sp. PMI_226]